MDGVKMQVLDLGLASLKDRWVKVSLDEDSFLLEDRFWDARGSWKDFLEGKKLKWPSLEKFLNVSFDNPELRHIHLCLHAPKLDLKGAASQLLGTYSLTQLSSELVESDYNARSKLAEALMQWTSSRAMLISFKSSLSAQFGDNIPSAFVGHFKSLNILESSLLSSVRDRTEEFFKARKACREKVFAGCTANLRADLLLKSSPFSSQLFEQGVVDTILSELRTADKDPGSAFGKRSAYDRSRSRSTSRGGSKRGKKSGAGPSFKPFHQEQPQGNAGSSQPAARGKKQQRFRGRGRGQYKPNRPQNAASK